MSYDRRTYLEVIRDAALRIDSRTVPQELEDRLAKAHANTSRRGRRFVTVPTNLLARASGALLSLEADRAELVGALDDALARLVELGADPYEVERLQGTVDRLAR